MILGWTVLLRSMRERRYRIAAVALLTVCACSLVGAAIVRDPRYPTWVWSAALGTVVAAAIALRTLAGARTTLEIAVGDDGVIRVRDGAAGARELPGRCAFVAPWLITLRCGTMWVPIWPDSVPEGAFRRLHACARWGGAADSRALDKQTTMSLRVDPPLLSAALMIGAACVAGRGRRRV